MKVNEERVQDEVLGVVEDGEWRPYTPKELTALVYEARATCTLLAEKVYND